MLGVGGQPVVDELLDDAAAAQGRADVVPAALAVEVLRELLVAGVALAALRDLGVDVRVGDRQALGLGDLAEDEEHPDPLLGVGPEVGVELLVASCPRPSRRPPR